jgi:hypothetical protein
MSLNLLKYFIHDRRDLSPAYVKSCEKFFKKASSSGPQAASYKQQAASNKLQATGALKKT